MKWLLWGDGWISSYVKKILADMNEEYVIAKSRADNEDDVEKELLDVKPDRVISLIGRTSGPGFNTIDYLEQKGKLVENVRDNLYAPFVLAMVCKKHGFYLVYLGTGCIFSAEEEDYGDGYTEEDKPDFVGSSYSTVKGFTDRMMHFFEDTVLTLRLRMPISSDINSRNFVTKITKYQKICSILNSMSVLDELLPLLVDMSKKKVTGIVNFTNPGIISHDEILTMYREIVDPNFTWENFTLEDQSKILMAGRSNNKLNTDKLQQLYPNILPIKDAVRKVLYKMKENMEK